MKPTRTPISFRPLAWPLMFTGACLLGFVAPAADSPTPRPSSGGPAKPVTLGEAIRLALAHNPELRASSERIDAAAGRAHQARRWSNPDLTLNAEDWPVDGSGGFSDAKQTIGVGQTIPFPGKKRLDGEIGEFGVRLSEAELTLRRLEVIRDVKIAFFQVLAAERLVDVSGELVKVAESSVTTAVKRATAGAATAQEQLRAEITLEQTRTELSNFRRELAFARQNLALLLGRPDLTRAPLSGSLAETANLTRFSNGTEQWLANHPSVVAAQTNRDRAELELRRARLEPYPDVKMAISGGQIGETGVSVLEMGFGVPLPILDRGKGRKQEAQANVRIAEADQVAVEQRLLRAWGTATQRLRTAAEQVANYRERILPKANEALSLVQAGFEQGKFGFIDLLDTQRTTAEVRLAYQQKLLELNAAQAELEALLGAAPPPGTPGG